MPSINLDCEKCDFHSCSYILWGDFEYTYEEGRCSLDRELAWCFQCKGLVPAESFNNSKSTYEEIIKLTESVKSKYLKLITFSWTKNSRKYKKDLDRISELSKKLQITALRKGTEKCLDCGSSNIIPFNKNYHLEYDDDDRNYTGFKRTGFIHPHCEGEIIASPNPVWINMHFTSKRYTVNGERINSNE